MFASPPLPFPNSSSPIKYEKASGLSERKMSFTSASMAFGAWPERANMCEPTINCGVYFDDCPKAADLIPVCQAMSLYERCAGVPVGTVGKNDWRMKRVDFRLESMIRTIRASSEEEVHSVIENTLHDSLRNRDLPWWEIVRIEAPAGCQSAILIRLDHVIGDGLAIVNMMESILTDSDGCKLDSIIPASMSKKFEKKKPSFIRRLCGWIPNWLRILYYAFVAIGTPSGKFDTSTSFRENIGSKMTYSWKRKLIVFDTIPLSFVKKLKNEAAVSLNDVMFSCFAGAIRRYNLAHDCPVTTKGKKFTCRALLPVAFPRPESEKNDASACMRNKWVFVSQEFGAHIADPIERLRFVNGKTKAMKSSPLAGVQLAIQESVAPRLPLSLGRKTVFDLFVRHSAVFSNVPGPTVPVLFGGREVKGVQMYFNNLIPQVGILSYCGKVFMNVNADACAMPGAEALPKHFADEISDLATKLGVETPEGMRYSPPSKR